MLLEEITPVVMVLSTPSVEEACLKNNLSFLQMLTPFCSFNDIDGKPFLSSSILKPYLSPDSMTGIKHCSFSCSAGEDRQWPAISPSQVQIALVLCFRCQEARFEGRNQFLALSFPNSIDHGLLLRFVYAYLFSRKLKSNWSKLSMMRGRKCLPSWIQMCQKSIMNLGVSHTPCFVLIS